MDFFIKDAGKIEFWTNLKQIFDKKIFDDTEMVCCIRVSSQIS